MLLGAVVLAAGVVAAAADARPTPSVDLTCGVDTFPSSGVDTFPSTALKNQLGAERRQDPAAAALRAFLAQPFPPFPKHGWQLLSETASEALFGHPPYGPHGDSVRVVNKGGSWQFNQAGSCDGFSVVRPGVLVARFALDRRSPLRLSSRILSVQVGNDCRGEPLRLKSVDLQWQAHRLVITILMYPPPQPLPSVVEPAQCIVLSPSPTYTITLSRPLGPRQIFDGAAFPPSRVSDYPQR